MKRKVDVPEYRITTNGRRYRVERLTRRLWWHAWMCVATESGYTGRMFDTEVEAREEMKRCIAIEAAARRGWTEVEGTRTS